MSEITFTGTDVSVPITMRGLYSDGTPLVKTDRWQAIVRSTDTLVLRPTGLNSFVTAMFLVDSIHLSGGWVKNLIMPYIPGARQDRINPTGDVLFTAKSVGDMVNQRNFSRVLVLDPHSPVSSLAIKRAREYPLELIAENLWQGYGGVIAPDKGAAHRAEVFAKTMRIPLVQAYKERDVATGRLSHFSIDPLDKGKHYLVVDDICDGGGTFLGLAEKIKEQGAFADLYVTHGIFSKGTDELKKNFKNIITTDSLPIEHTDVLTTRVLERMKNYV